MKKARILAIIGYALTATGLAASRIRTIETGGSPQTWQILAVVGVLAGALLVILAALTDVIAISKLAKKKPAYQRANTPALATLAFAVAVTVLWFFHRASIWRIAANVLLYLLTAVTAVLILEGNRLFAGTAVLALAAAASVVTIIVGRMKETLGVVAATGQKVWVGGPRPALSAAPAALMLIAHAICLVHLIREINRKKQER